MDPVRRTPLVALVVAVLMALVAPAGAVERSSSAALSATPSAPGAPARSAESVLASMTLTQRVGQLFMVGTPATSASRSTQTHIATRHVGNVMLTGRSYRGVQPPARTSNAMQDRVSDKATRGVRLFVATDQEGGLVQVLNGDGFTDMPTAVKQGTWSPQRLRAESAKWARQLRRAGVNVNLGPVLDTVPSPSFARVNAPVGKLQRHYGYTPERVASRGGAFAVGMLDGGVAPAVKHFPGLGRVRGNTDVSSGVRDTSTRRTSPYLLPFEKAVDAGTPFVMMSSAYYTRLDAKNPAVFSRFVIGTVLRRDLDFSGVVISDDLANARQLARWSPGQRAVKFLEAGGTMVLTVNPATLPAMYDAVLRAAKRNPAFRAKVDRAALTVLRTKEARGLL